MANQARDLDKPPTPELRPGPTGQLERLFNPCKNKIRKSHNNGDTAKYTEECQNAMAQGNCPAGFVDLRINKIIIKHGCFSITETLTDKT